MLEPGVPMHPFMICENLEDIFSGLSNTVEALVKKGKSFMYFIGNILSVGRMDHVYSLA